MNTMTNWRYSVFYREGRVEPERFERFEMLAAAEDRADALRAEGMLDVKIEPAGIDPYPYARIGSHLRTGYGYQLRGARLCAPGSHGLQPCEAVSTRWRSGHCVERPSTLRPAKGWVGCFNSESPATARNSMNLAAGYVAA